MIKLQTSLIWPGCAQGKYSINAKGFILSVLRWGNSNAPLNGWGPFAYVPIDPAGNGSFSFSGRRGIPGEATHVWARCYTTDFGDYEDAFCAIPEKYVEPSGIQEVVQRFSVLTDLHLAAKPQRIRQALQSAEADTILLVGDATHDGLPEQFAEFRECIELTVPEKTIFPVVGNHDILHSSRDKNADGYKSYADFQKLLLTKAGNKGLAISFDPDGRAYAVQVGGVDVIGLQCVTEGRRFLFPEGRQLDWLEEHMTAVSVSRRIILCHAPLLAHNPIRNTGAPYLDRDKRLQEILDRTGSIIFLSGHTHASPNVLAGNGEYDEKNQNFYLDCGSVVPTDTSNENGLMAPDWKDGVKTELFIGRDAVQVCMSSIESGIRFPRGYYRFST